ncbi:YHYH protein [Rubripirellula amarantea]|nr:YHYH protein [Rubripirellula amarantea]
MSKRIVIVAMSAIATGVVAVVVAQPPPRLHRVIAKGQLQKRPATSTPVIANEVKIEIIGDDRVITSNGVPHHKTGEFPNNGNPNRISAQSHVYRVPANPKIADHTTPMHGEFGVAINGVPFDPGAGEFYDGEPGWQYEPLSGAIDLGIDVSHAHVQPTGKYHYHGLPTGLIDSVKVEAGAHSPLVGWAADGFPIYAVYGYSDPKDAASPVQKLTSSYQLKPGQRPGGNAPGGAYDGTFVADYEYVEGSGDLDECNGQWTVTPEYPDGTYAYFMTEQWPVVPRIYRGTPSEDFRHGPGGGGIRNGSGARNRGPGEPITEARGQSVREQNRWHPNGRGGPRRGGPPHPEPPRPGQVLPEFVVESLRLSDDQKQQLSALQQTVDDELAKILTPQQRQRLESPSGFGPSDGLDSPGDFGSPGDRGSGRGGPLRRRPQ